MGTSILRGLLSKPKENSDPSLSYTAWVRSQTSLQRLRHDLGDLQTHVNCVGGEPIEDSISSADVIILGLPPGELDAVLATKGLIDVLRGKLIISLLAGVSCDRLASGLQLDKDSVSSKPEELSRRLHSVWQAGFLESRPTLGCRSTSCSSATGDWDDGFRQFTFRLPIGIVDYEVCYSSSILNESYC